MATATNIKEIRTIRKAIDKYLLPLKLNASIDNCGDCIIIEPKTDNKMNFDGLQIIYFLNTGLFEFSEYQAGTNQNELHIFGEYRTANAALKRLLKGKKQPVKVY